MIKITLVRLNSFFKQKKTCFLLRAPNMTIADSYTTLSPFGICNLMEPDGKSYQCWDADKSQCIPGAGC